MTRKQPILHSSSLDQNRMGFLECDGHSTEMAKPINFISRNGQPTATRDSQGRTLYCDSAPAFRPTSSLFDSRPTLFTAARGVVLRQYEREDSSDGDCIVHPSASQPTEIGIDFQENVSQTCSEEDALNVHEPILEPTAQSVADEGMDKIVESMCNIDIGLQSTEGAGFGPAVIPETTSSPDSNCPTDNDELHHETTSKAREEWTRYDSFVEENTAFEQNEDGDTLLHMAIINNVIELVMCILVKAGSPWMLDIPNHLHQSPLHLAVLTNQPRVARMLVARGAQVDVRDRQGNTPLHLACRLGYLDCVFALSRPIHHDEIGVCRYSVPFQRIPQDPRILNYEGSSYLHLAAEGDHVDALRYLTLGHVHADVNIPDGRSGRTILHQAVEWRHKVANVFVFLVDNRRALNLNANCLTYDGVTPLQLAVGRGDKDREYLLSLLGGQPGLEKELLDDSLVNHSFMDCENDTNC